MTTSAALFLRRPNESAALAALIVGGATTPLARHVFGVPAPFLTSVVLAVFVYAVVSVLAQVRTSTTKPLGQPALGHESDLP